MSFRDDLGFFWAMPNTIAGLLVGLFTFQLPRLHGGAIVFDRAPRGVTWLMPRSHRVAMTMGFVILSARPLEGRLLVHEQHHIRQFERLRLRFWSVYLRLPLLLGARRPPR